MNFWRMVDDDGVCTPVPGTNLSLLIPHLATVHKSLDRERIPWDVCGTQPQC